MARLTDRLKMSRLSFSQPRSEPTKRFSGAALPLQAIAKLVWIAPALLLLVNTAWSQNVVTTSDPQALLLSSKAIFALTKGQAIRDVTLTGTVVWGSGGTQVGTATLKALGTGESSVDLVFPNGTRSEIRDASTGAPRGQWSNPDGESGQFVAHNAMTDPVWFFPALGSLTAGPGIVLTYVGLETRNGDSVQHLRSCLYQSQFPADSFHIVQQLSTMDFYLDAVTLLPTAITFNQHPDDNASVNILTVVDFSNYQAVSNVQIPMHIKRTTSGATLLDITVTEAAFNSGLSLAEFSKVPKGN